ncbi:MAG: hypothetical protein UT39_C0015G0016 [Candidatus Woesebacteria bacterium GW2011_GWA1_39_21]|uniref:Uncharacterized protein n=1 Tax=Candidatus Woesebacteria bacterium GW2011_GWA1_39_21 TaxID=1618550 RepID=A0A0G0N5W5_9BACT|nr:MAG: hypothetical protein UT39_C0015G0016 [Candidatus Woesebacteria bacterium GW2011_GWA1_39_21]
MMWKIKLLSKYFVIFVFSIFLLTTMGIVNKVFASPLCDGVFICGDPVQLRRCSLRVIACTSDSDCLPYGYGNCQPYNDCLNPTNPANYQCSTHFDWESTCGPTDYCDSIGKCELYNYCEWLGTTPTPPPSPILTLPPGVTPSATPIPTSVPPTSVPSPTPTSVPNSPTCGAISGPSCTFTNTVSSFVPSCVAGSGSLTRVDMWFSPTSIQSWTNIYSNASGNTFGFVGPSSPATVNWPSAGNYYVTANAWNSNGVGCTSNPWCGSYPCSGFNYCGASNVKVVNVYNRVSSLSAPVLIGPSGLITCGDPPTKAVTLSWQPVAGATRYSVRANDLSDGWNGLCNGGENPNDLCTDYVAGTSYTYNAVPGHSFNWQVQAIYDNPCTGVAMWSAASSTHVDVPECPSCTILMGPVNIPGVGASVTQGVTVVSQMNGTISRINFILSSPIAHITSTNPDTASPFTVTVMGDAVGSGATMNAVATMNDNIHQCSTSAAVTVSSSPWFQVSGGNAIVKGGLTSTIPPASSAYDINFIRDPVALLIYLGTLDLGSGTVSSVGVSANTTIINKSAASFDLFYNKKLPQDVKSGMTTLTSNSMAMTSLSSCNLVRGYHVCSYDGTTTGDLTLTGNYSIANGVRVILFVNNANVTIAGTIRPATRGRSSFLLISKGNITIDPSVGGLLSDNTPDLEGVFYTDGVFSSGHNTIAYDNNLHVRGSVSANSFSLIRNLSPVNVEVNSQYPAEYFEYGTEQVLAFPPFLMLRATSTNEVSP